VDGALINGNLFDVLVAPSYFTIQPVRSETAMSAYPQKRKFVGMITMSALCQKQTSPSPDGAFAEAVIRSVELIVQRDAHDVVGGVSVGVNRGQVIEARPRKPDVLRSDDAPVDSDAQSNRCLPTQYHQTFLRQQAATPMRDHGLGDRNLTHSRNKCPPDAALTPEAEIR
jgi:hypothetical protein